MSGRRPLAAVADGTLGLAPTSLRHARMRMEMRHTPSGEPIQVHRSEGGAEVLAPKIPAWEQHRADQEAKAQLEYAVLYWLRGSQDCD